MKIDKKIIDFYNYFDSKFIRNEPVELPLITEDMWGGLYDNKILHAYIELSGNEIKKRPWIEKRLSIYENKILLHAKLMSKIKEWCVNGDVLKLKGESVKDIYPENLQRESRDVDVILNDERDFIFCHKKLTSLGFKEMFVWLRETKFGPAASAKFRMKNNDGERPLDDLYVEIHINSFPVTNFSNLYYHQLIELSNNARIVLLLLAEFTFRDGYTKRFTLRDIIDVKLSFDSTDIGEWEVLKHHLEESQLETSVLLLSDFWELQISHDMPALLIWLRDHFYDKKWDGVYSIIEHQAWRANMCDGVSRVEFDEVIAMHEKLFSIPRKTNLILSHDDLVYWMGRGMPVVAKIKEDVLIHSLSENYNLLDRFIY